MLFSPELPSDSLQRLRRCHQVDGGLSQRRASGDGVQEAAIGIGVVGEFRGVFAGAWFGDRNRGMNRRDQLTDITHVGGTERGLRVGDGYGHSEPFHVVYIQSRQGEVVAHRQEALLFIPFVFQTRSGGGGAGLEALNHAFAQLIEGYVGGSAHQEAGGGVRRHDVGGAPAVGDYAVNALSRTDVLAHGSDGVERQNHGVEGIDSVFGVGGSVGFLPEEFHFQWDAGQRGDGGAFVNSGMNHQGGVDVFECPMLSHGDLAALQFLGGSTDDLNGSAKLCRGVFGSQSGGNGGGGNQVVSAGVSDVGERVVFGDEGNDRFAGAEGGAESRG